MKKLLNTIIVESNNVKYKVLFFEESGIRTFDLIANDDPTEQYRAIINDKFYKSFIVPWSSKFLELTEMSNYLSEHIKVTVAPYISNVVQFRPK